MHGFELQLLPVTAPGVEQKATWLQVRQSRPDYVLLWGWGVMNSTALKEAQATGYPREKMYGGWYAGAEPDVRPAGDAGKGFTAVTSLSPSGRGKVHDDILKLLHGKSQGTGPAEEVGEVLYNRGLTAALSGLSDELIEAVTRGSGDPVWSGTERTLLQAADELHADSTICDATWEGLARHFTTEQLLDVVATVTRPPSSYAPVAPPQATSIVRGSLELFVKLS